MQKNHLRWIKIKVGKKAYEIIKREGLHAEQVEIVAGAAAGPKWISLYGIDHFLNQHWFKNINHSIHFIGSSSGSWRMACLAQQHSQAALDRFLDAYVNQKYLTRPSIHEVSEAVEVIVREVLGKNGVEELLGETNKNLHILSSRAKYNYIEGRPLKISLLKTIAANFFHRKWLNRYFTRVVFHAQSGPDQMMYKDPYFPPVAVKMNPTNMRQAMRASGTIPTVIAPPESIPGSPGVHWDGGIIDYHIALPFKTDKLIFFPHYHDKIKPGWFDKFLPWREAGEEVTSHMVMIYPTPALIASLPDQKLPDMDDFETYFQRDEIRIRNWYKAAEESKKMAEEFRWVLERPNVLDFVETF